MAEASAAVAAAQLLAFCKDPVRYRPQLTHGREIPPVGVHAFRFAQGKFPHGLLRELPAPERERLRKAANLFIRQVCLWDGATHYQVLCVPPGSRRETIKEHYHLLIALIHPDRQDADSAHWPPEAAHRVNLAYAVLSDEAKRAEYDARLHKSRAEHAQGEIEHPVPETASIRVPVRSWFAAARIRFRKPLLFVMAAVAGVFFLQVWLAADIPDEYGTLESATPLDFTFRAMRTVFSTSDRPRYLVDGGGGSAAQSGARGPATGDANEPFLTPLFRALSGGASERIPDWVPPTGTTASTPGVAAKVTTEAATRGDGDEGWQAKAFTRREPGTQPSASTPAVTPAMAVGRPASAFDSFAMETLVASLVTYYERGDLDRFMGLFDADSVGVAEAVRLRADFRDFFRETRERRLQVQRIAWDPQGETTRASGAALLEVEYRDRSERLVRPVALEVVVRLRDGNPRIARLTLFPHE